MSSDGSKAESAEELAKLIAAEREHFLRKGFTVS
tara:strand:- start:114 stop:215 length:102 start_codon:yes stop_codon:yes gene_type:complete